MEFSEYRKRKIILILYFGIESLSVFVFFSIQYLFRNTNSLGKCKHIVSSLAHLKHLKSGRPGQLPIVPYGQSVLFVKIIMLQHESYLLKGSLCK